jgi:hypothetical protein
VSAAVAATTILPSSLSNARRTTERSFRRVPVTELEASVLIGSRLNRDRN